MGIGRYFDMFNLALLGFIALGLAARAIWGFELKQPLRRVLGRSKGSNA